MLDGRMPCVLQSSRIGKLPQSRACGLPFILTYGTLGLCFTSKFKMCVRDSNPR